MNRQMKSNQAPGVESGPAARITVTVWRECEGVYWLYRAEEWDGVEIRASSCGPYTSIIEALSVEKVLFADVREPGL